MRRCRRICKEGWIRVRDSALKGKSCGHCNLVDVGQRQTQVVGVHEDGRCSRVVVVVVESEAKYELEVGIDARFGLAF